MAEFYVKIMFVKVLVIFVLYFKPYPKYILFILM